MPRLALATYSEEPALYVSDRLLIEPLRSLGFSAEAVLWDDPQVDWSGYDAVIVRSCWDYHLRIVEFRRWITQLEMQGVRLINSPALLRWNMDKHYLQQLAAEGIAMPPAVWLEKDQPARLGEILREQGWDRAVIKPLISASGDNTFETTPVSTALDQARLNHLLRACGAVVQRFAPQIREGEWSFVFFNGEYSHAMLKTPADGGFLVHTHHGGSQHPVEPSPALVAQARTVIQAAQRITGEMPVYARVDGVRSEDQLLLIELELIEPELFFADVDASAAERFCGVLAQMLTPA